MAEGFKIAEGYVEIETKIDNDRMGRAAEGAAAKAGDRAGDTLGKRMSQRFKDVFRRNVDRDRGFAGETLGKRMAERFKSSFRHNIDKDRGFAGGVFRDMFRHKPESMRLLLHPLEATFARPIAGLIGTALLPALAGALSAAVSSAVLLALGGGILAAGAAILVGNEKLRKKVSKQNQTQIRADSTMELKDMRLNLQARLAAMKEAGASDKAIQQARAQGEEAIRKKQLETQDKLRAAALVTNTDMTRMFTNTGLKIMEVLVKAASPLIGPFTKGANRLVKIFESLEPTLERMFTTAAPILPLMLDTFEALAKGIFPTINRIMPQITQMFVILAGRAPELADAISQLLIAMADQRTMEAFGLLLTGFIGSIKILAFLLPRLEDEFISTVRLIETVVHFFQRAPGYIIDAWQNVVQWFHTGWAAITRRFFDAKTAVGRTVDDIAGRFADVRNAIGRAVDSVARSFDAFRDRLGLTVDAIARFFRESPVKIMRFIQDLPRLMVGVFVAALEGSAYIVGRGLGTIVEFFVRLPGRIVSRLDAMWDSVNRSVTTGNDKVVSFFKALPGRVSVWWDRTWTDVLDLASRSITSIVRFVSTLPDKVAGWFERTWTDVLDVTDRSLASVVGFISRLPGRVGAWIEKTWSTVLETTTRWNRTIVNFIAGLPERAVRALVTLVPRISRRFDDAWLGAWRRSTDRVRDIITFVSRIADRAWQALVKLKNRLVDRFAAGWSAATGTSKERVAGIINLILGIPGRAFNALRALAGSLATRAREGWGAFLDQTRRGGARVLAYVVGFPGMIVRGLRNIGILLRESGRQLLQGLLVGVLARVKEIGGLGSWFKRNLVDPVVGAVKNFFKIKSPSKVFYGIGTNIVAGLWQGIASNHPIKMIRKLFGSMPKALGKLVERGIISLSDLPKNALQALGSVWRSITGFFSGAGGNLSKWVAQAVAITGVPTTWIEPLIRRAMFESRGDPNAINLWDINAILGHPSKGVMQMIDSTFNAFKLFGSIWDPVANIVAAIRYILSRYTSIFNIDPPVRGYRQGTRGLPEDIVGIGSRTGRGYALHRGEAVLRRNETRYDHSGLTINGGVHLHVDPKTIRDFQDVVDMIDRIKPTARMGPQSRAA